MTNIQDFKDELSFLALQNRFLKEDYTDGFLLHGVAQLIEIIETDFCIHAQIPDEVSDEGYILSQKLEKLWFYKEYLKSQIPYLFERYNDYVKDYINKNCLAELIKRKDFILFERHQISELLINFHQFDFLEPELYEAIKIQLIKSEKYINSDSLLTDKIFGIGKIEFLTNEQDLITLLYFLRENKIIKQYADSELGTLIESHFCIKLDDGKRKDLDRVGKRLNDLRNGNDSVGKSINRLKQTLNNDKFFEI